MGEYPTTDEAWAEDLAAIGFKETPEGYEKITPQAAAAPKEEEKIVEVETKPEQENPDEKKERSDQEIADLLFGRTKPEATIETGPSEEIVESSDKARRDRIGHRSEEELGRILYPPQTEQFQKIDENGQPIEDVIRDSEGLILHRGQHYGEIEPLIRYNSLHLKNAVLKNLDIRRELQGARMPGADLRGSKFEALRNTDLQGADIRGCTFKSLYGSDLRNVTADETTDLTGCDLTGAKYTLSEIQKAKGWRSCKGLRSDAGGE